MLYLQNTHAVCNGCEDIVQDMHLSLFIVLNKDITHTHLAATPESIVFNLFSDCVVGITQSRFKTRDKLSQLCINPCASGLLE